MLDKDTIINIINEIIINNNLTFFIDNYSLEIRKNIEEPEKYPGIIETGILKNDENQLKFLSNLYSSKEAKELFDNSDNDMMKPIKKLL